MNTSSVHAPARTNASHHSLCLQDLLERLIHGVTYFRAMPITEDAAIDRLNTLCRGSALCPHYGTLASHSHSGGPKHSDETLPLSCTLPGHSDQLPLKARSWLAPCLPKTPTATVVAKWSQTGTRYHKNKNEHRRLCLPTRPGYARP